MRRALLAVLALAACGDATPVVVPPDVPMGRVAIAIAPLELPAVESVVYRLEVGTPDDNRMATVAQRDGLVSDGPRGSFSYVAPCVAGPTGAELAQVTVEVLEVRDADGPLDVLLPPPLSRTFTCRVDADTPVEFNVAVMRPARSGFTDLTVDVDEVFCSAKADCDPTLMPTGAGDERGTGLVTGLACTANPFDDVEVAQTLVYAAELRCAEPADVTVETQHFAGEILIDDKQFHNTATGFVDAPFAGTGCALDAVAWLFSRPVGAFAATQLITPIPIITWVIRGFDNDPTCHMDVEVDATYADVGFVYDAFEDVGSPPAVHLSLLLLGGEPWVDVVGGRIPVRLVAGYDAGLGRAEAFLLGSIVGRLGGVPVPLRVAGAFDRELDGQPLLCVEVADVEDAFYTVALVRNGAGRWTCLGDDSDFVIDPGLGMLGSSCDLLPLETAPCALLP